MNRMARDEVLHAALDEADLPSLDEHDRPNGVIVEGAHCIGWLQRGIDWFHHQWPFAGTIKTLSLTITAGTDTYTLASDHVKDVRDGLLLSESGKVVLRAKHSPISHLIEYKVARSQATNQIPRRYVITPPNLILYPTPDKAYTGTLYYYSLPNVMTNGAVKPVFPSDWVLVEYVRLRAQEWAKAIEPTISMEYAKKVIGEMHSAGYGREAELNYIPLDDKVFIPSQNVDPNAWMGEVL